VSSVKPRVDNEVGAQVPVFAGKLVASLYLFRQKVFAAKAREKGRG
jgi:hypothetical protein